MQSMEQLSKLCVADNMQIYVFASICVKTQSFVLWSTKSRSECST